MDGASVADQHVADRHEMARMRPSTNKPAQNVERIGIEIGATQGQRLRMPSRMIWAPAPADGLVSPGLLAVAHKLKTVDRLE